LNKIPLASTSVMAVVTFAMKEVVTYIVNTNKVNAAPAKNVTMQTLLVIIKQQERTALMTALLTLGLATETAKE